MTVTLVTGGKTETSPSSPEKNGRYSRPYTSPHFYLGVAATEGKVTPARVRPLPPRPTLPSDVVCTRRGETWRHGLCWVVPDGVLVPDGGTYLTTEEPVLPGTPTPTNAEGFRLRTLYTYRWTVSLTVGTTGDFGPTTQENAPIGIISLSDVCFTNARDLDCTLWT